MFERTIELLDSYYQLAHTSRQTGFIPELASEVKLRLQQMDWLLARIRDLEKAFSETDPYWTKFEAHAKRVSGENIDPAKAPLPTDLVMTNEDILRFSSRNFEIMLFTEAFYYFAERARNIITNGQKPLPGLSNFEAKGVRNVRNQLLEHPEKTSQIFTNSIGWGGPQGPVIKAVRYGHQTEIARDAGLYVNAEEFRQNLEFRLEREIGTLKGR